MFASTKPNRIECVVGRKIITKTHRVAGGGGGGGGGGRPVSPRPRLPCKHWSGAGGCKAGAKCTYTHDPRKKFQLPKGICKHGL